MILKYKEFENLASYIKSEKKNVIIYGAGMIGNVFMPYFIEDNDLFNNLLFFVDKDSRKHGTSIKIGDRDYLIKGPEVFTSLSKDTVMLVTVSQFKAVIDELDNIEALESIEAYVIPVIMAERVKKKTEKYECKKSDVQLIPKKIHYCWFSRNPMPECLQKCMDSWQKMCPDYEIIQWNEDNYDVEKNEYMKEAYRAKKWGFVPDIARLDILYNHGGIYLDTDVELKRNLDELLYQEAFCSVEKWGSVNTGAMSGTVKGHPMIKKILDYRINEKFVYPDGSLNLNTCGFYETKALMAAGLKPTNETQVLGGMTVYSSEFFQPYDYMSNETIMTENTFSIHHFNGGWLDEKSVKEREETVLRYKQMLKRMGL